MEVKCTHCGTASTVLDEKVPIGRSYFICPACDHRVNVFKGLKEGSMVKNLVGVRFFREDEGFHEEYCEPGELWHVVKVTQPCPDKGDDRECERNNKGRCPNQRLLMRLDRDNSFYRTCLYRNGRKLFDKTDRTLVGAQGLLSEPDDDATCRIS
jgi:DNA-directed RNA polymerase subunit RPC12/RpoP